MAGAHGSQGGETFPLTPSRWTGEVPNLPVKSGRLALGYAAEPSSEL